MAFVQRTKKGFVVKHGGTGQTLSRFSGKNAEERAKAEMKRLHKEHNPKASNRGKRAAKRFK